MFNIEFYTSADGTSELWNFLDNLQQKSLKSKDARIQHKQITMYIQLLEDYGTQLGENISKHLVPETIEYSTFSIRMTSMFFFTSSAKRLKKHHVVKLKRLKLNVTIGFQERDDLYANMVRL
jgi:hypothetical protein